MNLHRILLILSLGSLVLPSNVLAITSGRLSRINGVEANIRNGSIPPDRIYDEIKKLQLSDDELKTTAAKKMDATAATTLSKRGFNVIPTTRISALTSAPAPVATAVAPAPMPPAAAPVVTVQPSLPPIPARGQERQPAEQPLERAQQPVANVDMMIENLVARLQSISSGDLVKAIQGISLASLEKGVVISKDSQKVLDCLREARDIWLDYSRVADDENYVNAMQRLVLFESNANKAGGKCLLVYNNLVRNSEFKQLKESRERQFEELKKPTPPQQPIPAKPAPQQPQQVVSVDTMIENLVEYLPFKSITSLHTLDKELSAISSRINVRGSKSPSPTNQALYGCLKTAQEIWSDYSKVADNQNAYVDATNKLAEFGFKVKADPTCGQVYQKLIDNGNFAQLRSEVAARLQLKQGAPAQPQQAPTPQPQQPEQKQTLPKTELAPVDSIRQKITEIQDSIGALWSEQKKLAAEGKSAPVDKQVLASLSDELAMLKNNYVTLNNENKLNNEDKKNIRQLLADAYKELTVLKLFSNEPTLQFNNKEEAEEFVRSKGLVISLLQDLIDNKITNNIYEVVLECRTTLKRFADKINSGKMFTSPEIKDIQDFVNGSLAIVLKDYKKYLTKFDEDNQKIIIDFLKKQEGELKTVKTTNATEQEVEKLLSVLKKEIDSATVTIKKNQEIPDIPFRDQYTNIKKLISSISEGGNQAALTTEAHNLLAQFMRYVAEANTVRVALGAELWRLKQDFPDEQRAIEDIAQRFDDARAHAKSLRDQYMPFIADIEGDNKVTAQQLLQANTLIKVLHGTPKESQLGIMSGIFAEFDNGLSEAVVALVAGKFMNNVDLPFYNALVQAVLDSKAITDPEAVKLVQMAWNDRINNYATHLINVIGEYSRVCRLPDLHKVASENSVTIANNINNMLGTDPESLIFVEWGMDPEKNDPRYKGPVTIIGSMLNDLKGLSIRADLKNTIYAKLWQNFSYMLAAFDGFSYALFNKEIIKADQRTGFWAYLWSFFGYRLLSGTSDDFKTKYQRLMNEFFRKIVNAINIYHDSLLMKVAGFDQNRTFDTLYNSGTLNIITNSLGTENAKNAGLLKPDGSYVYAIPIVPSPLNFPGGDPVHAAIPPINALHQKSPIGYDRLVDLYSGVVAAAYRDPKWAAAAQVDQRFAAMKEIAQKHDLEKKEIERQIRAIEANLGKELAVYPTIKLRADLKQLQKDWEAAFKNLQADYEVALAALNGEIPETLKATIPVPPKPPVVQQPSPQPSQIRKLANILANTDKINNKKDLEDYINNNKTTLLGFDHPGLVQAINGIWKRTGELGLRKDLEESQGWQSIKAHRKLLEQKQFGQGAAEL